MDLSHTRLSHQSDNVGARDAATRDDREPRPRPRDQSGDAPAPLERRSTPSRG
jgi:hypothetical protein